MPRVRTEGGCFFFVGIALHRDSTSPSHKSKKTPIGVYSHRSPDRDREGKDVSILKTGGRTRHPPHRTNDP